MRSLDDIIDQEYENDDGEIICQLEREIRERDAVIVNLYEALMEHYQDAGIGSATRLMVNEYGDFVNGVKSGGGDDETV